MNANPRFESVTEEVKKTAYLHYIASGCVPGRDLENWLAAQEEIVSQRPWAGEKTQNPSTAQLHFPLNANVSRGPFGTISPFGHRN